MSSINFIQKLKELGVPDAEKLQWSDYDWIFMNGKKNNDPLVQFLDWFVENIHSSDVLSDSELKEYEALEQLGETLTGQQLEDAAESLSTVDISCGLTQSSESSQTAEDVTSELAKLKDKLKKLTLRRDQLSLQKMELRSDIYNRLEKIKAREVDLSNKQRTALNVCLSHQKSLNVLVETIDDMATFFTSFSESEANEAKFVSQLDLESWYKEEEEFQRILKIYINKQFEEEAENIFGQNEKSEYHLLEPGSIDLQLVRGKDSEEYIYKVNELERLSKMLELTEHDKVKTTIDHAKKKGEIEELERIMKQPLHVEVPATQLLKSNIDEINSKRQLVQKEITHQSDNLFSLASRVSQLETTRTISGDYEIKLKRQEYYIEKQNFVKWQLISQLARYDMMNIVLDLESKNISDALEVLTSINGILVTNNENFEKRIEILEEKRKSWEEKVATNDVPKSLQTIHSLLKDSTNDSTNANKFAQMDEGIHKLNSSINALKHKFETRDPRNNRLKKMNLKCKVLEENLFTESGSLSALPDNWLPHDLLSRQARVNEKAWKFSQDLLALLKDLEEKKKVYEVNPHMEKMSIDWVKNVK